MSTISTLGRNKPAQEGKCLVSTPVFEEELKKATTM